MKEPKDLINWVELSRLLANNETSVSRNRTPKKYQDKVNSLIQSNDRWKKENINKDIIDNYAEWNFDLVSEDDVEDTNIDGFSNEDILDELAARKILGGNTNIINQDFLFRFSKIIDKENNILLESILNDLEKKLKI